jgi:tRNA G46 methylase TrmB
MSVALYIVLERRVPGLGNFVNGKALGHAGELLDVLAEKAGTKPLMEFFSASPETILEFASGHGVAVEESAAHFPSEKWFPAEEGLVTIRGLRKAARTGKIDNLEKILTDLDEFERVLKAAKEHGIGWHLAVDY